MNIYFHKSLGSLMSFKYIYSAHKGYFFLFCKNGYIVNLLQFKMFLKIYFEMSFIPVMSKLVFQYHYSSSVSHNPSEITLICWFTVV